MQSTRGGVLLPSLSLWIIVLLSSGACARKQREGEGDDEESWSESVSRARCASRCLSLHSVEALSVSTPLQNNGSLGWCLNHKQCAKCLEPCKGSWEMKRKSNCRDLCERAFPRKHWECVTSCEFLQSVLAVKQGSCPPPERASGFAAACVESCDHDRDCSTLKKCCSNGCGHTCQTPKDMYKGAPLKPRKELSFSELPSGQLEVRWSSRFNISAEPVVYVLQRRWNFGIQPSEDSATPWQLVAQTTEQGARLSDTRPGRWYQFRVAAVNTHGTRGFTTPSRHIHSSRDPPNPPAPSELRVSNMTFGPGRAVSARLQWSAPRDLDVPVHHYKVSWSWMASGQPSASSLTKRRKTVRESRVELDSMRANRSYSVEVQAVSYWGQSQLRGPRAVLHFSTQPGTQPASSAAPRNPTGDVLDVGTPFYQDGLLRVHVYWQSSTDPSVEYYRVQWKPEHCAHNQSAAAVKVNTQESFVSLQDLLFSCKYRVLLQPLSTKTRPPAESAVFFTPSCAAVQAKSRKPITCHSGKAPPHKVLIKPANLTAAFEVRGGNLTAIFSWDLSPPPSYLQLTGYQVTWTEVVPTNRLNDNKLPHSLISQSQILPPDANVLVVFSLHPDSVYRLDVQVVAADGEGPAASRTFQTPGTQSTPRHRPRTRTLHQNLPIIERH